MLTRTASSRGTMTMTGCTRRLLLIALLLGIAFAVPAQAEEAYDPWPGLVQDIFSNRPMNDGSDVIAHRDAVSRRGRGDRARDPAQQAVARR